MGDEAAAPVTPATSAEIAKSSDDPSDDEILAELDKEFGKNDEDEPEKPAKDKPKPKDEKPASKPKPKADDDSDDEDEDEDEDEEKVERKPAKKDEADEDDDDQDDDDPKDKKRPRLDPKTPHDVKKFFNEKWREYRLETEKRDREFAQDKANFQSWISDKVGPALKPALGVMKALHEAGFTGQADAAKAIRVMRAMADFAGGDAAALKTVIEEGTGHALDKGTMMLVKGSKTSAAEQRLNAKIADLEKKLEAKESQETETQTAARREAAIAKHLETLTEELEGHPVTKLKGFAKKVFAVQRKSYDPKLRSFKLSPEEAANKVLKIERRRRDELRVLDEDETPATRKNETAKPKDDGARVFALNRGDSREGGALDDDQSDDDILKDLDREFARRRREEAKAGKGKR